MKKFLLSVFMCMGIIGSAGAMEQPLDISYLLETCPNQIASGLDGKSFSSLTQVCTLFQEICNHIPTKYLAIDFSDAAEHKNKNLIDRFIAQPDGWMFEPGMGQEIFWENNACDIIKIFKRSLGGGLQRFLGDCSFYCVSQADEIVRCFWIWKSPELFEDKPQAVHCTSFNIDACDDAINMATTACLKCICGSIENPNFSKKAGNGNSFYSFSELDRRSNGTGYPKIVDSLYPVASFIKKFGMLMVLVLTAQKNNMIVVHSILNNSMVPQSWIGEIVKCRSCNLKFYSTISVHEVLARALKSRLVRSNEC